MSEEKQALGMAWWKRMNAGRTTEKRSDYVGPEGSARQTQAAVTWNTTKEGGSYDRLGEITIPVLVANGDSDIIVPTANSWILQRRLPNAYLHIYPDAGHGFIFEYASLFAKHIDTFLDDA